MKPHIEMPEEVLLSLGFIKRESPYGGLHWTHQRDLETFYYYILTPEMVTDALVNIGQKEFKRKIGEIEVGD
jgi:hypothetical protein